MFLFIKVKGRHLQFFIILIFKEFLELNFKNVPGRQLLIRDLLMYPIGRQPEAAGVG